MAGVDAKLDQLAQTVKKHMSKLEKESAKLRRELKKKGKK
jgi:hypothetical protein